MRKMMRWLLMAVCIYVYGVGVVCWDIAQPCGITRPGVYCR